jgi:protein-disulfide isomerase
MLQVKVFGTTPPCANCMRAEKQALAAAKQFPGQVEVVKLDAMGPEAEAYGLMSTPLVVVGDEVVGRGKVVPAKRLAEIIADALHPAQRLGE